MTTWEATFKSDKNTGTLYFTQPSELSEIFVSFYFNNDEMNNMSSKFHRISPLEFRSWDGSWIRIQKQSGSYYLVVGSETGQFQIES